MHDAPYRLIPLRNRAGEIVAEAKVDEADYEWAMRWRWHRSAWGYVVRGEYLYPYTCPTCGARSGKRRQRSFRLHREMLGLAHGDALEVDHVNGDRLDNRRANLRVVTRLQNAQNVRPKGRTSLYRGVSLHRPTGTWQAVVRVGGRMHHLGYFHDEQQAARVASDFRRQHMPYSADAAS